VSRWTGSKGNKQTGEGEQADWVRGDKADMGAVGLGQRRTGRLGKGNRRTGEGEHAEWARREQAD
jgi:hypothetical protein